MLTHLLCYLPGTTLKEATFVRRGFVPSEAVAQQWLEQIGQTFLLGYQASLRYALEDLPTHLNHFDSTLRGFAFEGAAMGLALLDLLTFRSLDSGRWKTFMSAADGGEPHIYMSHVGLGWALAGLQPVLRMLPHPIEHYLKDLHPVLRWLALDGYGFHAGYFHWPRFISKGTMPRQFSCYASRVFTQGLGRSLWFVKGANVNGIADAIETFPETRRADLWSGVGLACSYAGGVSEIDIHELRRRSAQYWAEMAQGAVFAAKARHRAATPTQHTQLACKALCGLSDEDAAHIADITFENLPPDGHEPSYEVWRQRIQAHFRREKVAIITPSAI